MNAIAFLCLWWACGLFASVIYFWKRKVFRYPSDISLLVIFMIGGFYSVIMALMIGTKTRDFRIRR